MSTLLRLTATMVLGPRASCCRSAWHLGSYQRARSSPLCPSPRAPWQQPHAAYGVALFPPTIIVPPLSLKLRRKLVAFGRARLISPCLFTVPPLQQWPVWYQQ